MIYLVMFKTSDGYYFQTNKKDNSFVGGEDINKILINFEYNHSDSTWSASSCINYISFTPSVVAVNQIEDIKQYLGDPPFKCVSVRNISGGFEGVKCISGNYEELFELGIKPSLI